MSTVEAAVALAETSTHASSASYSSVTTKGDALLEEIESYRDDSFAQTRAERKLATADIIMITVASVIVGFLLFIICSGCCQAAFCSKSGKPSMIYDCRDCFDTY